MKKDGYKIVSEISDKALALGAAGAAGTAAGGLSYAMHNKLLARLKKQISEEKDPIKKAKLKKQYLIRKQRGRGKSAAIDAVKSASIAGGGVYAANKGANAISKSRFGGIL